MVSNTAMAAGMLILAVLIISIFNFATHKSAFISRITAKYEYFKYVVAKRCGGYASAYEHILRSASLMPNSAFYLNLVGEMAIKLEKYAVAREFFELAIENDIKSYGENHLKVASHSNSIGDIWYDLKDFHTAKEYYEIALNCALIYHEGYHADIALYQSNIASAWRNIGDYEKSIEFFELALTCNLNLYGEGHTKVNIDRSQIGRVYYHFKNNEKALEYFELALRGELKTAENDPATVAKCKYFLGLIWSDLADYPKAIKNLEFASNFCANEYGLKHFRTRLASRKLSAARNALEASKS